MVGRDEQGDSLIRMLTEAGVDTSGVQRTGTPTNSTVCVVHSSGDRLFLHRLGASSDVTPDVIELAQRSEGSYSHLHLANLFSLPHMRTAAPAVLARAHELGLTTSLDTGWDARGEWMSLVAPCLPHTDLLFVNESEGKMLTGSENPAEIVSTLRGRGAGDIVLKLGGNGCIAFSGEYEYVIPRFDVKAIDTTGAGDCFAGGFLSAIYRGLSFAEAARFANAVGALSVEKLGAVKGLRNFEETLSWMSHGHPLH
jgi:sugar/nucleoside kinase (ribokinase family)